MTNLGFISYLVTNLKTQICAVLKRLFFSRKRLDDTHDILSILLYMFYFLNLTFPLKQHYNILCFITSDLSGRGASRVVDLALKLK